jgi:hypothetical protein
MLSFFSFIGKFREFSNLISSGLSSLFSHVEILFFLIEFSLDLQIDLVVTLSHSLWDLLTDFFTAFFEIHVELSEIFLEISLRWLANSLSLFNEVIFNFSFTVDVCFIGFIVHDHLSFLLIEKSFSHVFVLLKSRSLCDVL